MKIITNLLESIEGIEIWYIAALLIFFFMFIVFLVRIFRMPRHDMDKIKRSILDEPAEIQ